jgi:hypothetical protein
MRLFFQRKRTLFMDSPTAETRPARQTKSDFESHFRAFVRAADETQLEQRLFDTAALLHAAKQFVKEMDANPQVWAEINKGGFNPSPGSKFAELAARLDDLGHRHVLAKLGAAVDAFALKMGYPGPTTERLPKETQTPLDNAAPDSQVAKLAAREAAAQTAVSPGPAR